MQAQTEEQLCRAVKRLHAYSETDSPDIEPEVGDASHLLNGPGVHCFPRELQDHVFCWLDQEGAAFVQLVGLEHTEISHLEGHASASVSLHATEQTSKAVQEHVPSSSRPGRSRAEGTAGLQNASQTGEMQGSAKFQSAPLDSAAHRSATEQDEALSAAAPIASVRPWQTASIHDNGPQRPAAADEAGPSGDPADVSQLPGRLRRMKVPGDCNHLPPVLVSMCQFASRTGVDILLMVYYWKQGAMCGKQKRFGAAVWTA